MGRLRYSSGACNLSVDPSGKCKVRISDPLYLEWKSKGDAYRRGIVKAEEKQKLMQECLQYFRERPVYEKVFQKMRGKYESLGHIGGKVVLTGLSLQDKSQLGGFLQKDYTENQSVTISAEAFEICLSKSRFSDISLEELLDAYFGKKLTVKKEERRKKQEERDAFFAEVQSGYEDTTGGRWLQNTLKEHTTGYEILQQQYNSAPEILREILKYVFEAVKQLPRMEEKELLPVFAAKLTGDPHYFDASTVAERLLFIILSACWQETKDRELSEAERKNQIFYRAGILKDDLSNDTLVYGIRAWKHNGNLHKGIEGFFQEREPVRLTLRTIGTFGGVHAEREKIYLFENPAVFSVFVKKYPDCAAICGNGQPRLATLLLLDFLKENHSFYYHGDFDPEGLLIAQRLKERYGESICLWNYRADWYERYLSDVNLSEVRMKKLEKVYLPELLEVKMQMQKRKRAAYQEAMLDMLEPEKK